MSNSIQSYTPQQLTRIRELVNGESPFKSIAEPASDGLKDVIIMGAEGDLAMGAETVDLGKDLSKQGVAVKESLDNVGVTARVDDKKLAELEDAGYRVFDDSPRTMMPSIPRGTQQPTQEFANLAFDWKMPEITPAPWLKSDSLQAQGITGQGQIVAVLDSGFDHPEFELKAWKDITNPGNTSPVDPVGHGTHVAGDVLQTAPDAEIVAVKVMGDNGMGRPSDIIRGLQWVVNEKKAGRLDVDVINMSLGGEPDGMPDTMDPVNRAVTLAAKSGITVIAAAGNSGPDARTLGSPADSDAAIAVGAALNPRTLSDFSSRGPTDDGLIKPDVVAPGEWITSWAVPGSEMAQTGEVVQRLRDMSGDDLKKMLKQRPELIEALGLPRDILTRSGEEVEEMVKPNLPAIAIPGPGLLAAPGTSFAAPLVAGVVAQLEQVKDINPAQTKAILRETAEPIGNLTGNEQGTGFVNAERALEQVKNA